MPGNEHKAGLGRWFSPSNATDAGSSPRLTAPLPSSARRFRRKTSRPIQSSYIRTTPAGLSPSGCRRRRQGIVPSRPAQSACRHRRGLGRRLPGRSRFARFLAPGALSARGHVHRLAPARADDHRSRRLALSLSADALAERSFANLFLMWPTFASVEGFRKFHWTHHQYTNLANDGNRHIWYTHDAAGELEPDWVFPKTRLGLALVLLRRALFLTGLFWIVRGLVGSSLSRRRTGWSPPGSRSMRRLPGL